VEGEGVSANTTRPPRETPPGANPYDYLEEGAESRRAAEVAKADEAAAAAAAAAAEAEG